MCRGEMCITWHAEKKVNSFCGENAGAWEKNHRKMEGKVRLVWYAFFPMSMVEKPSKITLLYIDMIL